MPVVTCPGCGARLNINAKTAGKFACPKCKKEMRLKQPASSESKKEASPPSESWLANEPISASGTPKGIDPLASYAGASGSIYSTTGSSNYAVSGSSGTKKFPDDFNSFVKKLGIGVGILAVVIIASLPLTSFSKSFLCLVPIFLVTASVVGLALWWRIWMIKLGFAKSTSQGVMMILVPSYWIFFVSQNKQQCMKPIAVLGSCIVPGLLGILIIAFFKPDIDGASSGRSLNLTFAQRAKVMDVLSKATADANPNEILTAQYQIWTIMKPDAATNGELALVKLPGYVAGSMKISPDQKTLTLQYRSSDKTVATQYAFPLPGEAGIMLDLKPTLVE